MYLKDLKDNLISVINESKLDVDMIYFVMKDLMAEVTAAYNSEVRREALEQNQVMSAPNVEIDENIEKEEE